MKPLVLVADDEEEVWLIERALADLEWPCLIQTFLDGASVMTYVRSLREPPAMVIPDQLMPDLEGLQGLKRFRCLPLCRNTWIVVMSGTLDPDQSAHVFKGRRERLPDQPSVFLEWKAAMHRMVSSIAPEFR
ncbi:response regulator [Larkinella soli]|uniref:response regulator n=1 Tax=Larkinella soli TaxID=1770527 RepID=UPI000FFB7C8D|nr:response regulator [Larkinella soli]